MKTILIIEDDPTLRMGMEHALTREGFFVLPAGDAGTARALLDRRPHLALLDLNLPDGNGFIFCGELISAGVPVIFLTVRDDERDITQGLDMGGDDYVTKPFKLTVLISRIRAVLRRYEDSGAPRRETLTCGGIALIQPERKVTVDGGEIPLTPGEYKLLLTLLQNKNKTLTRGRLLELLWDESGNFVNDNTLTVTVKRLREKLGRAGAALKTVRGIGYKAADGDED
ncbi:MAG: response regulator transcription factor [Clostridiales bacterium]|nr:response regulator transcription factor [Clostridiales bacterium]